MRETKERKFSAGWWLAGWFRMMAHSKNKKYTAAGARRWSDGDSDEDDIQHSITRIERAVCA